MISRAFLVHVVFNVWMRRHFRRQLAIVGSDRETTRVINHIIDQNAPFWVAGVVDAQCDSCLEFSVRKNHLGDLTNLPGIVGQYNINEIIVTDEQMDKRTLIVR